jgi:hypothetical protein
MADNGGRDLDHGAQEIENAPQPADEQKTAAPAAETPTVPGDDDAGASLLRSAYRARTAATEASSAGDFSHMESTDQALLLRGAYLAHLSEGQGETAGEHGSVAEDIRRAYVARIGAEPRPQRGRAGRVKGRTAARAAAAPAKKRAAKKPPARAAVRSARKVKAKARTQARSKARAARTGRRKRPRR